MGVKLLKLKVIEDVERWAYKASYGNYTSYKKILHTISLIEVWNEIDIVEPLFECFLYE